jgi:hypothetical protein
VRRSCWCRGSPRCSRPPRGGAGQTGSINGRVIDAQGGVMPGVTVTAASAAQMGTRTEVTNDAGMYRFPAVAPGRYTLHYTLGGFTEAHTRLHQASGDGRSAVGSVAAEARLLIRSHLLSQSPVRTAFIAGRLASFVTRARQDRIEPSSITRVPEPAPRSRSDQARCRKDQQPSRLEAAKNQASWYGLIMAWSPVRRSNAG